MRRELLHLVIFIHTHTHLLCLTWISLDDCRRLIDAATVVMYVRQTMPLLPAFFFSPLFPRNSSGKFGCWTTVPFFFFRRRQHNNTLFLCVSPLRPFAGVSGGGAWCVFFLMPFVAFDCRLVVESWSTTFVLAVVVVVVGKRPASKIRYVRCGLEFYAADEFEIDMREFCFFFHALKLLSFFF